VIRYSVPYHKIFAAGFTFIFRPKFRGYISVTLGYNDIKLTERVHTFNVNRLKFSKLGLPLNLALRGSNFKVSPTLGLLADKFTNAKLGQMGSGRGHCPSISQERLELQTSNKFGTQIHHQG